MEDEKIKVAVFASGSGSNAECFFEHFSSHQNIKISGLYTNNEKAYAIERAKKYTIPFTVFDRRSFYETQSILATLQNEGVSYIVLAGFMWLVPQYLVHAYPKAIINIHPALLPKFGGKGMYGMHVHKAVKKANELETGITIHYVNEVYDDGQVIFQEKCHLETTDTPETIAKKVQRLEHQHYPQVVEDLIRK